MGQARGFNLISVFQAHEKIMLNKQTTTTTKFIHRQKGVDFVLLISPASATSGLTAKEPLDQVIYKTL